VPRRVGLVLLSLVAGLVLLEIGLRVIAHATSRERALVFDPDLGWRMTPGASKLGKYWGSTRPATTNAHGFRDRARSFEKTPGTTRALAIGDSFTFGADVDDGERFSEALERSTKDLEVLNLGVNAYGPDQELRLLELEGFRYAPDVVLWIVFLGNDLNDVRYARRFHYPRPYFSLDRSSGVGELVPHRANASWDVRLRESCYLGEALFQATSRWIPSEGLAVEWSSADTLPLLGAIARRISKDCAEHHARLLVVLAWPPRGARPTESPDALAESEPAPRVRAALESIPVELFDTHDLFAAGLARGEKLYGGGGHWTPLGHARLATALLERLRVLGWVP
jgi:lysophospholipase L1-like esterase